MARRLATEAKVPTMVLSKAKDVVSHSFSRNADETEVVARWVVEQVGARP